MLIKKLENKNKLNVCFLLLLPINLSKTYSEYGTVYCIIFLFSNNLSWFFNTANIFLTESFTFCITENDRSKCVLFCLNSNIFRCIYIYVCISYDVKVIFFFSFP